MSSPIDRIEQKIKCASAKPCSLCYESSSFMARGVCGHSEICWLCTVRLRWICNDNACAICKTSLNTIDIIDLSGRSSTWVTLKGVRFPNAILSKEAKRLTEFHCPTCSSFEFRSLRDLQTHLKRDHQVVYCTVCLEHRQCFLPEQVLFDTLATHMQQSHPSCAFCRGEHFYSPDELLTHMQQAHFKCVVCERLDFRNEYYANCAALTDHSSDAHFPCTVPECVEQRFVVFADEDELALHAAERHGGRVSIGRRGGGTRRHPNRYPQDASVVHFRGPKIPNLTRQPHGPDRYPDLQTGEVYDKVRHGKTEVMLKSIPAKTLVSFAAQVDQLVSLSVADRQAANVEFLAMLQSQISPPTLAQLKDIASKFRSGSVSVKQFVDQARAHLNDQLFVSLVGLMPDAKKRDEVVSFVQNKKSVGKVVSLPSTLWETPLPGGEKRPCLIHALNAVLETNGVPSGIEQTVLHAMEGKINGLDRIQLSTLSELRNHLLILATSDASWAAADEICSLRPLLYRLLHVPDSHRNRANELIAIGWAQFVEGAHRVISKFSSAELKWLKAYLAICALRLATIGPLDARRRTDFPAMQKQTSYFPTLIPPAAPAAVPGRADFPPTLAQTSTSRTTSSVAIWQNSTFREAAFPQLDTVPVLPVAKNWTCTRCTFLNTHMLALCCEICGKERPPAGTEEPTQPSTNPLRSKRSKQKVILSSSTQRDYTR